MRSAAECDTNEPSLMAYVEKHNHLLGWDGEYRE
jgi:hypothetical protein